MKTSNNRNHRLAQFRRWHTWGGVFAGLFLLVLGTTGVLLNYKQPIFAALGLPTKRERDASPLPPAETGSGVKLTTTGIAGGSFNFDQALALAKTTWGDAALERVEIRSEKSGVVFRLRSRDGAELWIDAASGRQAAKGEYERLSRNESGGEPVRSTDWGKILLDLHTGKIGGAFGKAVMSAVAVVLLLLTLSGIYLWLKPLLIRRQNAKSAAGPLQTANMKSQATVS